MKKMKFTFNIFTFSEAGTNVAYCMEMGLVATNDDSEELIPTMEKLIRRQLQFALENDNPSDIFHPAPDEIWEKFRQAIAQSEQSKAERPLTAGHWDTCNEVLSYAAV